MWSGLEQNGRANGFFPRQSQVHKHGTKLSDWVINFPDFYPPYATLSPSQFGLGQHISSLYASRKSLEMPLLSFSYQWLNRR